MAGEPRFLPRRAPIDAYGNGGFRFADMSHRGSLLALPSGMRAWPVTSPDGVTEASLDAVFAEAAGIEFLLLGMGLDLRPLPQALRWRLRDVGISADPMSTPAAVRTWNVLLAEDRRVAAALIAVD